MGKRYYWLKLKDDFFKQKEIKKLRKIAGGDTYTIIYLKMLLLSINNDGKIYYDGIEDTFAEEIALELDEDAENVQLTIAYLLKSGLMVSRTESEVSMTKVPEMVGCESESAERVRRHREKKKLQENQTELLHCNEPALHCNTDVTKCNTEKEKEKDIEKREKRKELVSKDTCPDSGNQNSSIPGEIEEIVTKWNEVAEKTGITSVYRIKRETTRYKMLKKRIKDYGSEAVIEAINNIALSPFLWGNNNRGWEITFDWFVKPNNFVKVLEGNYISTEGKSREDIARKRQEDEIMARLEAEDREREVNAYTEN